MLSFFGDADISLSILSCCKSQDGGAVKLSNNTEATVSGCSFLDNTGGVSDNPHPSIRLMICTSDLHSARSASRLLITLSIHFHNIRRDIATTGHPLGVREITRSI